MNSEKSVIGLYRHGSAHMVGDGFNVRNLFPSNNIYAHTNPFFMLDYAGPTQYGPSERPRGVDEHPHRGFETVTIVYQGEVDHRDSSGNSGSIGPGDVQWMTAASGVVHEEKHGARFTREGGTFQVVQLWVNLPAEQKMSPPRYQALTRDMIPSVKLDGGALRVIAGEFAGVKGPARSVTPLNVLDLNLSAGHDAQLDLPAGHNTVIVVLSGKATINGRAAGEAEMVVLASEAGRVNIRAQESSLLLVLDGQPINEPVAAYGPFVMNTQAEIMQAVNDYRAGKMGRL